MTVTVGALMVLVSVVPALSIVTLFVNVKVHTPLTGIESVVVKNGPCPPEIAVAAEQPAPVSAGKVAAIKRIPTGSVSLMLMPDNAGLPAGLVTTIVMVVAVPWLIGLAANNLVTVGGTILKTRRHCGVIVLVLALLNPVILLVLFVNAAGLVAQLALVWLGAEVTSTLTEQLKDKVAPRTALGFKVITLEPAIAVTSEGSSEQNPPPPMVIFGVLATTMPDGRVSVNPMLKTLMGAGGLGLIFCRLNVSVVTPPAAIVLLEKPLVSLIGATTVRQAFAPAAVMLFKPVKFAVLFVVLAAPGQLADNVLLTLVTSTLTIQVDAAAPLAGSTPLLRLMKP